MNGEGFTPAALLIQQVTTSYNFSRGWLLCKNTFGYRLIAHRKLISNIDNNYHHRWYPPLKYYILIKAIYIRPETQFSCNRAGKPTINPIIILKLCLLILKESKLEDKKKVVFLFISILPIIVKVCLWFYLFIK